MDSRAVIKGFLLFFILVLITEDPGQCQSERRNLLRTKKKKQQNQKVKTTRDHRFDDEREIRKILNSIMSTSEYDNRVRPNPKGPPIVVRVDMLVSNIWSIQEVNMDFTIDIYLRQYWRDRRLQYNPPDFPKPPLTLSGKSIESLWIPSTYFVGAKKAHFHDVTVDNYLLQIYPDGSVFYSIRITVTETCHLDFRNFPHDIQTCKLTIESYGYQATDVIYIWNSRTDNSSAVAMSNFELPQFNIYQIARTQIINQYNIGNHSALSVEFFLQRRIGFYMINTYVPSFIIVCVSWISFWIDAEAVPARIALGITTVLTMTTIEYGARQNLPKVSYVRAMDWYLLVCLVFVFSSMLEYTMLNVLMNNMTLRHKKQDDANAKIEEGQNNAKKAPPEKGHKKWLAEYSTFSHLMDYNENNVEEKNVPNHRTVKPRFQAIKRLYTHRIKMNPLIIDKAARVLFPMVFLCFNIIYWVTYWPSQTHGDKIDDHL